MLIGSYRLPCGYQDPTYINLTFDGVAATSPPLPFVIIVYHKEDFMSKIKKILAIATIIAITVDVTLRLQKYLEVR